MVGGTQSAGGDPPYRVSEVARKLGVSNKAVLEALKSGRLRARLIRNLRRVNGCRAVGGLVIELAHPINALAAAIREQRPVIPAFARAGDRS